MPLQENNQELSLESIEFIFRHPWLFLCPIIIILSLSFAKISNTALLYQSSAVLAADSPLGTVIDAKFTQQRTDLMGRILLGSNIKNIIKEVWPQIKEETDPNTYNLKVNNLRNPKNGITLEIDKKDPRLLNISFTNPDPKICFKVVQATIDTIQRENKQTSEKELTVGLNFLKKQLDFYKDKMQSSEKEMANISEELRKALPELSDYEKTVVKDLLRIQTAPISSIQQAPKYEEMIAELDLQLLDAKKKKQILERNIATGNFTSVAQPSIDINQDSFIKEYSKAIAAKQLAMAELTSKGYLSEHPDVRRLAQEAADLNALKEARIKELTAPPQSSEQDRKIAENNAKTDLEDIDSLIETINNKIALLEQYQSNSKGKSRENELRSGRIYELATRLTELRNEKQINQTYYNEVRKQLEGVEIKSRMQKDKETELNITVIEMPKIPLKPIPFQSMSTIFMGLILGIGAGTGLAYITDYLKQPIKSSSELRGLLGVPVLASIYKINTPQEIYFLKKRRIIIIISLVTFIVIFNLLPLLIKMGFKK